MKKRLVSKEVALDRFPDNVRAVLEAVTELNCFPESKQKEGALSLFLTLPACRAELVLYGAEAQTEGIEGSELSDVTLTFSGDSNDYTLEFSYFAEQGEGVLSLTFTEAKTTVTPINAAPFSPNLSSTHDTAIVLAANLAQKERFGGSLNERETELLPLIKEIDAINAAHEGEIPKLRSFPNLIALAEELECKRLVKELRRLEAGKRTLNPSAVLQTKNCGRLWMYIFSILAESQTGYPTASELMLGNDRLCEVRDEVTREMNKNGFSGAYPDFTLTDGKLIRAKVRCVEYFEADSGHTVSFIVYRIKDNDSDQISVTEAYFTKPRDCRSMCYLMKLDGCSYFDCVTESLPDCVSIVHKLATHGKLTKKEKRVYYGEPMPIYIYFVVGLICAGVGAAFGIVLSLLGTLFEVFALISSARYGEILDSIEGALFRGMLIGVIIGVATDIILFVCRIVERIRNLP